VTGLGCASPLGGTAAESWRRAQRGESAAAQFDIDGASFVAARCGDLALDEKREKARVVALALRAAAEAVRDAGGLEAHAPARRGASIASGVGGLGDIVDAAHRVAEGKKLSPFFVPRALCNTAAGAVSLQHSCAGPVQTSAAACAAGAQSVGDAFRLVQRGDCDVALCGGAEACVDEVALRGFARMGALSRDGAARPFDAARSGFVLGEGAAVLVLEDAASAARRGARAYAELRGYGLGGDAVHMSAPPPDGAGVLRAARAALGDAGLDADLVDHVNAHAAGTPAGDAAELAALEALLEGRRGGDALVLRRPFVCLLVFVARLRAAASRAKSHRRDQSNAGSWRRRRARRATCSARRARSRPASRC
jgi:3-oxoacyl-[acyl-carrier-protein] synthase II